MKIGTCEAPRGLEVERGEREWGREMVGTRFAPSLLAKVGVARGKACVASVANEAAQQASTNAARSTPPNLPLAQKISIGTPVTGKKAKTGPVMASRNAKAERFKVFQVMGDGRCMFRALVIGLALTKGKFVSKRSEEAEADTLRIAAAEALCRSARIQDRYADSAFTVKSEYGSVDNYCELVKTPDFWGGNAELMVLSDMLEQPIVVYRPEREARGKGKGFVPYVYYGTEYLRETAKGKVKKPVNLLYSKGNHYDLLVK
ncbi:OTU-like cysteine protease [Chloropicon primus]|uniref:Ubiquitin thioesterase OTU n=2 Tax=Chloropicon primus TaxID=1764295 RepID=A0A5B8MFE9_9CHLO|nr:OTU-like cysteine protease [Chloropicon primus]UPQ98587.1 OTU-like cysteine protease [Chloropicon primus]|eukprot:QDZ19378.1 OTU-like cysteine protease [Chloropicon primus]